MVDSDPAMAPKALERKFERKIGARKVELKREFQQSSLESNQDPDKWLTMLVLLRRWLKVWNVDLQDNEMMIHVLENMPKEYDVTVELCENELTPNTLTTDTLKKRLWTRNQRLQKDGDGSYKTALFMKK